MNDSALVLPGSLNQGRGVEDVCSVCFLVSFVFRFLIMATHYWMHERRYKVPCNKWCVFISVVYCSVPELCCMCLHAGYILNSLKGGNKTSLAGKMHRTLRTSFT